MNEIIEDISYTVNRKVVAIEIENGLYCYKEVQTIENKEIVHNEGFTKNLKVEIGDFIKPESHIYLMKKEVLSLNLSESAGFDGIHDKTKYINFNPYTYITNNKNWNENHIVLDYYSYSGDLKKLDGTYYPKRISFDYINGSIDNENYDLEKLLDFLKTKDNIQLKFNTILNIPYYNCEEGRNQFIAFDYIPTDKEYNELKKCSDSWIMRKNILNNLGINQFKKEVDEDED